jgi:hypothetical protein
VPVSVAITLLPLIASLVIRSASFGELGGLALALGIIGVPLGAVVVVVIVVAAVTSRKPPTR